MVLSQELFITRATSQKGRVARRREMASITVQQGCNIYERGQDEDEVEFARRMEFYARCTQWINELERILLAKSITGGVRSFSLQYACNVSSSIASFGWRNKVFCILRLDPKTGNVETPFVEKAKRHFFRLMNTSELDGVQLLSGFLIEVVKNEISYLDSLRSVLKIQAQIKSS